MIKFESEQECPTDAKPDGVVVIPVNCQGILEHTVVGRRFKAAYPESYDSYMRLVYNDKLKPGQCVLMNEKEQPIALLVWADAEFGKLKDLDADMVTAFSNSLDSLFERTKDISKYYSGVIKVNNIGKTLMTKAKGKNIEWIIQKD